MTPNESHDAMQARLRLFRQNFTAVEVSMKTGDGETRTATINVPDEALSADVFSSSLEDFVQDALAVRMIQVWVTHYCKGEKVTTSLFVPVLGWHLLSVNWEIVIEEYVQQKFFRSRDNQSKPAEDKRTGPYSILYRRNGESGEPTRKERFNDWLVGLTARGSTVFRNQYYFDWPAPPMPKVKPPLVVSATS